MYYPLDNWYIWNLSSSPILLSFNFIATSSSFHQINIGNSKWIKMIGIPAIPTINILMLYLSLLLLLRLLLFTFDGPSDVSSLLYLLIFSFLPFLHRTRLTFCCLDQMVAWWPAKQTCWLAISSVVEYGPPSSLVRLSVESTTCLLASHFI